MDWTPERTKTNGGNLTLDCKFDPIGDPARRAAEVKSLVGVIECGLFAGMATDIIIGEATGVRIVSRDKTYVQPLCSLEGEHIDDNCYP